MKMITSTKADLTNPFEFKDGKCLEKQDLVLVHRTNYFPENGVIRTRLYSEPDVLRYTVHFSLNGPVRSADGVYSWEDMDYAIIIPFDKLDDCYSERIMSLNPTDTFLLGDIELPEGSIILSTKQLKDNGIKSGNAEVKEIPAGNAEEYIYREITDMGYCPMQIMGHNWGGWDSWTYKIFNNSAKNMGIHTAYKSHDGHWTHAVEDESKEHVPTEAEIYSNTAEYVTRVMQNYDEKVKRRVSLAEKYLKVELEKGDEVDMAFVASRRERLQQINAEYEEFTKAKEEIAGYLHRALIRRRTKLSLKEFPDKLQEYVTSRNERYYPLQNA